VQAAGIDTEQLLHVRRRPRQSSQPDCLVVTAPIIRAPVAARETDDRLVGYVTVGLACEPEITHVRQGLALILGAGCVLVILAFPLSYLAVHRIFQPIRKLLAATRRVIEGGDLDARVVLKRADVIGQLSRAFNDMIYWVKQQRHDLKAAHDKLAEANHELESKVEQRTAALEMANQRLSQEIAEKEDFLRAISHDLNAPLRNISGMATMLLMKNREKFDEEIIHRLERIKTNVDVETDLINELLELSRIKTRRHKVEPVDVEQLVWELRGMFENDLKSKHIELRVDSQLPVLHCERARIRQVFQNLIDNAIKYMGTDKFDREIHVGCAMRPTEAEFYVRDTGMGIEADEVDKVFFVFRRGRNQSVQNIAGKGVGLASVKSIIETYNGRIWVESELGKGSTFKFTINAIHVPACGGSGVAAALAQVPAQPADADEDQEPINKQRASAAA
jgi:signal transduction histidine kinase